MEDSRLAGTPMSTRHKLSKNDDSKEVDQTTFRSMIAKLQYVVHTRLDIALGFGMVTRFLANPKENYMMEIKRIMRYLKGIEDYGLWYKLKGNLDLKVLMKEKTLVVDYSFLVKDQCLGQVRKKITFLSP